MPTAGEAALLREFHRSFTGRADSCSVELLYVTGADCHLCEHGRNVLAAVGLDAHELDVDSPEAAGLAERGIPLTFLPVLTDGERVVGYGRLSEKRLRRELGL